MIICVVEESVVTGCGFNIFIDSNLVKDLTLKTELETKDEIKTSDQEWWEDCRVELPAMIEKEVIAWLDMSLGED